MINTQRIKVAHLYPVREWFTIQIGERINCSTFSLPNGYDKTKHDTRDTGFWGFVDIASNTRHARHHETREQITERLRVAGWFVTGEAGDISLSQTKED